MPANEPVSRLEPLKPFILRWRGEGKSYERIRAILRDECSVKVAHSTLFKFVKSRSKPRKLQPEPETEQLALISAPAPASQAIQKNSDQNEDPYAEARVRMRQFKEAPAVRKSEPLFPVYTDDELLEPHILKPIEEN